MAPALAMGNTVVLKPATVTRLSALLFAEICAEAGLPKGVFNVVTGGGAMGQTLAEHPDVDKVGGREGKEIWSRHCTEKSQVKSSQVLFTAYFFDRSLQTLLFSFCLRILTSTVFLAPRH